MAQRALVGEMGVIPIVEPSDIQNGLDTESVVIGNAEMYTFVFSFGTVTGNSVMKFFTGATVGAKDTAVGWSYQLSGADYKAAAADQYGAKTAVVAGTGLTLAATTFDHRVMVVDFDAVALSAGAADGTQLFLTCEVDNASSALFASAICLARGLKYAPAPTAVSTA